jgi:hypothetical protein
LLGVLDCGNSKVMKALEKAGVKVPELRKQVSYVLLSSRCCLG